LGILVNLFEVFCNLKDSIIGAMAGYLILWFVFQLFKFITKKEGMGFGDFKLLAAIGAWTGFIYLPQVILISSVVGSVAGISLLLLGKTKKKQPIPFGPYLAIAGIIALLWGDAINSHYLALL
jgi:leader peptidase (prepilin peptidase)/N-methyltransferase